MRLLSDEDIRSFQAEGFLQVPGLLNREISLRIQKEIWKELEEAFGIKEYDPSTWRTPPHSPRKAKCSPTNEQLINKEFRAIIDTLIGKENWKEPSSWGGFLITFPSDKRDNWTLHDKLWHWDYELFRQSDLGGLLIFSFYSKVPSRGGGTLVIKGSHKLLRKWKETMTDEQLNRKHGQHRKEITHSHPYLKKLISAPDNIEEHVAYFMDQKIIEDGIPLQVVELKGDPGDVVFCHRRLIHAPAGVNLNNFPRIMRTKFLW